MNELVPVIVSVCGITACMLVIVIAAVVCIIIDARRNR